MAVVLLPSWRGSISRRAIPRAPPDDQDTIHQSADGRPTPPPSTSPSRPRVAGDRLARAARQPAGQTRDARPASSRSRAELHYRTDRRAAGLRTGRSQTLALLLFEESPDESQINPFFLSMLAHITQTAARRNFDLLISFQQLGDDWHSDYEVSNRADGLILLGYGDYVSYADRLRRLAERRPLRHLGAGHRGTAGHYLSCDNARGARLATEHLLPRRRQIALRATREDRRSSSSATRLCARCSRRRLEPDAACRRRAEPRIRRLPRDPAARSGVPFDAVFAASDLIASA